MIIIASLLLSTDFKASSTGQDMVTGKAPKNYSPYPITIYYNYITKQISMLLVIKVMKSVQNKIFYDVSKVLE